MSLFTIALLQMASHGTDQEANLAKGEAFCRQAAAQGADLALFPECWNTGYAGFCPASDGTADLYKAPERWAGVPPLDPGLEAARREWAGRAVPTDGPFVAHFRQLAAELQMAIAITYLQAWEGGPRNAVSLIDRHGEILFTYAKVHTCDFDANEAALTPGDGFHVACLDTASGPVWVGAMICYDREFPESARLLMLQGAEVVLTPNACELETNRLSQFRTRAMENMMAVAMTNYAAPQENGHSIAFDGVAFSADGRGRDMLVVEAGEGEGVYLARIDLDRLRAYRSAEAWGNAFRRPHRYGLLASAEVRPPFVRVDRDGRPYPRQKR